MSLPVPKPSRQVRRLPAVEEVSAGGVVVDVDGGTARIAIIARRNRAGRVEWCLPKGHMEGDETLEEAAVREVAEETGITGRVLTHARHHRLLVLHGRQARCTRSSTTTCSRPPAAS